MCFSPVGFSITQCCIKYIKSESAREHDIVIMATMFPNTIIVSIESKLEFSPASFAFNLQFQR